VCSVLEHENVSADFVSIYFISDRVMRQYHKKYFQDPSPTDCISFPVDSEADSHGPRVLGDVFVCPKTAHLYVQGDERKFWEELTLYIVHGLLHLLGYEDMPASARSKMRAREKIIISALKKGQKMISGTFS
jgi:probable rRNA maturation factor